MRTFYSILFTPIRPAINEQVSIGLMLINESNVMFKYSLDKIHFLSNLIPHEAIGFLKTYLKNIDKSVTKFHRDRKDEQFLSKQPGESRIFQYDYYNYLNKYSNNLITFSKPIDIDIELNESNFNIFFEKYVAYLPQSIENIKPSIIALAKERLYPTIENNVNVDLGIEFIDIPALQSPKSMFPDKVNIIGKNDQYLSGQFFDFDKKAYLKADLSFYLRFVEKINDGGNHYLIGDEPDKSLLKNHSLWDDFRNLDIINYVPNSEVEIIEKYILDHDVQPILELDS